MAGFPIGIQLYSVRTKLENDFDGTLRAIAAMGYQGVEFAWEYGGKSPEALAAFLKSTGLVCCGLHSPLEGLQDKSSDFYRYAKAVGSPYVTTSLPGHVAKDWAATIEDVRTAAGVAASLGFQFTYHNHAEEFQKIGGEYALDILYRSTDAGAVQGELDTYWITKGGADPAAYIRSYKGRVPQVHLKDMDKEDGSFTELGRGRIDLSAVFQAAADAGAKWVIYEQDSSKGDSLESARISIENLKAKKFA